MRSIAIDAHAIGRLCRRRRSLAEPSLHSLPPFGPACGTESHTFCTKIYATLLILTWVISLQCFGTTSLRSGFTFYSVPATLLNINPAMSPLKLFYSVRESLGPFGRFLPAVFGLFLRNGMAVLMPCIRSLDHTDTRLCSLKAPED